MTGTKTQTTPVEEGWVIEHGSSPEHTPLYFCGCRLWQPDYMTAVRFAREVDARAVAEYLDEDAGEGNYRICLHEWVKT